MVFMGGLGCPKKTKKLKAENVPLSCGCMDQVEKKSLKDYIVFGRFLSQGGSD